MILIKKRKQFFFSIAVFIAVTGNSQQVFFQSDQVFNTGQLGTFYSSMTIQEELLIFNANDYRLYAYNLKDTSLLWSCRTGYKTNTAPFIAEGQVFAGIYEDESEQTAKFDISNGKLLKILPVGPLGSKPFYREAKLWGTAIYDGGCLFAYDIKEDSLLWWKFLAHGYSTQPYYFPNYIQANAEGDNWVKINYKGAYTDTNCAVKADIFVQEIPCVTNFIGLTHDGVAITGKLAEKIVGEQNYGTPEILTGSAQSFIIYNDKLTIIGNKGKIWREIELPALLHLSEEQEGLTQLLDTNLDIVTFVYKDQLIRYNYSKQEIQQQVSLASWQPHQVIVKGNKCWLISKKDGLLYGIGI